VLAGGFAVVVGLCAVDASAADAWPPPNRWPPSTAPVVPGAKPPAPPPPPVVTPPPEPEAPAQAAAAPEAAPSPEPAGENVVTRRAPEPPTDLSWRRYVGLSENRFFVRTAQNELVLFPGGLFDFDARSFHTDNLDHPGDGLHLDRARLETAGLVRDIVSFNLAVNLTNGPSLHGVDDYVAVGLPLRTDRAIIQAGQFDAPFTMENRISDRSLDFLERSTMVRAFAIPENKAQGAMVHGTDDARNYYYAAGIFLGDGQTEGMGRGWVAPTLYSARVPQLLRDINFGGSLRFGHARSGAALPAQSTQSGFVFLSPHTRWLDGSDVTDVDLRTRGNMYAVALELNAPLGHKLGSRIEWTTKHQPLETVSVTNGGMPAAHGGMSLGGWATYGEIWYWVLNDDRVVGEQGLQLPIRLGRFGLPRLRDLTGVMLAARMEYLDEDLAAGSDPMAAADVISAGSTKVTTLTLGANVWFARRVRATLNYDWSHVTGNSVFFSGLTDSNVQELSLALSLVL
jgi:hypothetical protein